MSHPKWFRGLAAGAAVVLLALSGCSGVDVSDQVLPASSAPATPASSAAGADSSVAVGAEPAPVGAAAVLGAPRAEPFPGDTELTDKSAYSGFWRSLNGRIVANDGLSLAGPWWHATGTWQLEHGPADGTSDTTFQVNGTSPGMVVTYRIHADGKATDDWIGASFYSPSAGANQWSCAVYKGDPRAATARPTVLTPYTCVWSDVRGWNPKPTLNVSLGTVVTDKDQAKQLLSDLCNDKSAKDNCDFINFGYATELGPVRPLGSTVSNRSDFEVEKQVGGETEERTSNSIGVEVGAELELFGIFKASVTAKYEHEWEVSHTFSEETTVKMEKQSIAWMTLTPLMQGSEGTWIIADGDKTWVIPSFQMTGAVPDGGHIDVYGCDLAKFKEGQCTEEPTLITTKKL